MPRKQKTNSECAERLGRLFERLDAAGLDSIVLDNRDDQFYFSGYTGSDSVALLSVRKRKGWLITDARYAEEAETTAPGLETTVWKGRFPGFVGKRIASLRLRKIAYTPRTMTAAFCEEMRREAALVEEWVPAEEMIHAMRSVKSPCEIVAIEKALRCAEGAFRASKKRWQAGMTEIEVRNDLEWEMRKRGAQDTAFETIVAVGANASLPHAHAGDRVIAAGKMLLVDFGARLDRYNSDLTRTLWCGDMPAIWLRRYRAVLAAQKAGIEAVRAGVAGQVPDMAARKVFAKAGWDSYFTHGLGHGVGLAVHEDPRLSRICKCPLSPGNVVTVEPGIYFPGSGGIRVEDMAVVENDGAKVISDLEKGEEGLVFNA